MERVLGVGGVFLRSRDPAALARWYEENLGVPVAPVSDEWWRQRGGLSVIAVYPHATDDFGRMDQQTMINYRVRNLDAIRTQLRLAGATVSADVRESVYGVFCWAEDPDGNRFELWQPAPHLLVANSPD